MHTFDGGSLAETALGKRNTIMQFSAKIFLPWKREGSWDLIQSSKECPFVKWKYYLALSSFLLKNKKQTKFDDMKLASEGASWWSPVVCTGFIQDQQVGCFWNKVSYIHKRHTQNGQGICLYKIPISASHVQTVCVISPFPYPKVKEGSAVSLSHRSS